MDNDVEIRLYDILMAIHEVQDKSSSVLKAEVEKMLDE
jgi:hypothetical protein